MAFGSCFHMTFVRELAELSTRPLVGWTWDMIVERLTDMTKAIYNGWGQTKIVEDTNRVLRDRETRDVNNRRLSMINYWSAMRGGKTIELHERAELIADKSLQSSGNIPGSMFTASDHIPELPGADEITGKTTWRSYSPQTVYSMYAYIAAMQYCQESNQWGRIGRCWLAMLFRPGMVVNHVVNGAAVLVLDVMGACAVLCWKLQRHRVEDVIYFTPTGDCVENESATWIVPLDVAQYEVVPVKAVSPVHLWLKTNRVYVESMGVVLLKSGEPEDLWTWAALKCFWGFKLPQLNQFSKFWKVEQPTPELFSILKRLIKRIIPAVTPEELSEILRLRCVVEKDHIEDLVDADVLDDLLSPDEAQAVQVCG